MHEAAITQAILEQVQGVMPPGGVLREVHVEVGDLEHLDGEVMRTVWAAMLLDAGLSGAELRIDRVPLRVRCGACGVEYVPEDTAILLCPECGAVRPEVLEGSGVLLRSLEVEE